MKILPTGLQHSLAQAAAGAAIGSIPQLQQVMSSSAPHQPMGRGSLQPEPGGDGGAHGSSDPAGGQDPIPTKKPDTDNPDGISTGKGTADDQGLPDMSPDGNNGHRNPTPIDLIKHIGGPQKCPKTS